MSWARLDDRANEHRKLLAAGAEACWLWACGLMYANRQAKRDGFIPSAMVPLLYPVKAPLKLAAKLVEVGLWEAVDGGYRVHDYHDVNPTADEVAGKSAARAEAGRKGGARSGEARRSKREANCFDGDEAKPKQLDDEATKQKESITPNQTKPNQDPPQAPPGGSGGGSDGSTGSRTGSEPDPPAEDPSDPAYQIRYREIYAEGVKAGKGSAYAVPRGQFGDLNFAIQTHAKGGRTGKRLSGERLHEWIRLMSEEFARWLAAEERRRPGMVGFYSSFGPTGFLKWLNEQTQEGAA